MIISASRRTDIPAFFGEWFINRLRAGEVLVRNPMNPMQVTNIPLSPDIVDCIVFWTKDPGDFMQYLDEIDELGYKYYFLFTLNSYGRDMESDVDRKKNIIQTFQTLSDRIGPEKVIWRYDPIIFNRKYTLEYHTKWFAFLARELSGYTEKCVISFLDEYNKIKENISSLHITKPDLKLIDDIGRTFSEIARRENLKLVTCAHDYGLEKFGIGLNKCVDNELIESITGYAIRSKKDPSQRNGCLCIESRDIGSYNTCGHHCVYCYANNNGNSVMENLKKYDRESPVLCDELKGDENISLYKKAKSLKIL